MLLGYLVCVGDLLKLWFIVCVLASMVCLVGYYSCLACLRGRFGGFDGLVVDCWLYLVLCAWACLFMIVGFAVWIAFGCLLNSVVNVIYRCVVCLFILISCFDGLFG